MPARGQGVEGTVDTLLRARTRTPATGPTAVVGLEARRLRPTAPARPGPATARTDSSDAEVGLRGTRHGGETTATPTGQQRRERRRSTDDRDAATATATAPGRARRPTHRDCRGPPRRAGDAGAGAGRARPPSTPWWPRSRGCACTPSPRCRRRRPRSAPATTGPSAPGRAPRAGAVVAEMGHHGARRFGGARRDRRVRDGARTKARLAASRPSANPVGVAGSRQLSRSVPGATPADDAGPVAPQGQAVGDGIAAARPGGPPRPGPRSREPRPRTGRR